MTGRPFHAFFAHVLREAAEVKASDVHFEPFEGSLVIKFRVDSVLRVVRRETDGEHVKRLQEVIKQACGFNMGIAGVPQDTRFAPSGGTFDCRASLCPTLHGEKIVLRLLEREKTFDLEAYSLPAAAKRDLQAALNKWQGAIIVSGPTGSGKTTLLYSALGTIDRIANNVHSIEDPIEYSLPNLNQTQVEDRMGFAGVIRSLMRQDPDVILVGEVRDEETAEAMVHAAATGHLVLTTVHANSAREVLTRLEGLGVRREMIEANILFASAQRLAPRLCSRCSEPDEDGRDRVRAALGVELVPRKARGCSGCRNGVEGRVLLFEWLTKEREEGQSRLVQRGDIRSEAVRLLREGMIDADAACGLVA